MRVKSFILIGGVWACGLLLAAHGWAQRVDGPVVRDSMKQIFSNLRVLLPASVAPRGFRDPASTDEIRTALNQLAEAAGVVAKHVSDKELGARFLGRSLEREAREAAYLFDQGEPESAQFTILQMTEYCVECHSRSAIPADSTLSKGFLDTKAFANLGLQERARLQFATREFSAGLDTLDGLLSSSDVVGLQLPEVATNYLVVSIRLKGDFARARGALSKLADRPDLRDYQRLDVEGWLVSLKELEATAKRSDPATLEQAISILDAASDIVRFPTSRQALVHYVVASTVLQRFVEGEATQADKALAYYLLGVVESRLRRSSWLALPYSYWEASIELDPAGKSARQAYALLEEEALSMYASAEAEVDVRLPSYVQERLERLRGLIEKSD